MENKEIITDVSETETNIEETLTEGSDIPVSNANDGDSAVEGEISDTSETETEQTETEQKQTEAEEETEQAYTQEELEQIVNALLANDEAEELETQVEEEESIEVPRTLFNTPLEEYTVSEGLLVCIFLLLFANLINSIFKGSHWFSKL